MLGHRFSQFIPPVDDRSPFEQLLPLFLELLTHTSGDVEEALDWMDELNKEHGFWTKEYGRREFEADLREKGMIGDRPTKGGKTPLTGKAEKLIRERALDQVFGKLKKSDQGNHGLKRTGEGDEPTSDRRAYRYGDRIEQIAMSDSIRNAQQHGVDDLRLNESDLEVIETEHQSACATVLMVPSTLVSNVSAGCRYDSRTNGCAARCITACGWTRAIAARKAAASRMSTRWSLVSTESICARSKSEPGSGSSATPCTRAPSWCSHSASQDPLNPVCPVTSTSRSFRRARSAASERVILCCLAFGRWCTGSGR